MTRVLHAMAGAAVGGAEAFFERLVLALGRAGAAQRVAMRAAPTREAALRQGGIEPVELRFGGFLDWGTRPALAREIARFRPDIVMTWMSRATQKCPRPSAALPFVHVGRLGGYYDLKYYRGCDHLVANTEDIVDHLVRGGWPRERAHYLPNFVADRRAAPVARESLDTPAEARLLLAMGRLHVNKAFDVLLRALVDLPGCVLWLAGEGPEEAGLKRRARALGVMARVRFLGWRRDVPALLAACEALVCPSRHEPLGNVIIEAWSAGKPVVATASQGPRALVREGESGLLVAPDDPAALAAAIGRVLGDRALAAQIVAGGRRAYEARFTEAAVVAQYRAFFDRVARRD